MSILHPIAALGESKVRVGVDSTVFWEAPEPLTDTALDMGIQYPASTTSVAVPMTRVHDDLTVIGIGDDRATLTLSATPTDTDGLAGRYGAAHLITPHGGVFEIRVVQLDGTSVRLADTLPRALSLDVGDDAATLRWAVWSGSVLATDVASELRRGCLWSVEYTAQHGADAPEQPGQRDMGMIHVVNQPFSTGLTHSMLVAHARNLGEQVDRGSQGWDAYIGAGLDDLVLDIRERLTESGRNEDQIPAGQLLRPAHVAYTLAQIYTEHDQARVDSALALAARRVGQALASIFVDESNDGVVDDGELDTQVSGGRAAVAAPARARDSFAPAQFIIGSRYDYGRTH